MTSYTNIFTGNPVQTTPESYRAFTLSADTELSWALYNEDTGNVTADVMEITSIGTQNLIMPPANQVSAGKSVLIRNVGSSSFKVKDNSGNDIQNIVAGGAFWIYVTDNSDVDGAWSSFQFGTGTSAANASQLAGNGLKSISSLLNVDHVVKTFNTNFTLATGHRANVALWTAGVGTFSFSPAATLTDGWFIFIRNAGSGALTLDPNASELIDGATTATVNPGESCIVACTGSAFYTISKNSVVAIAFTRLVKSVAGSSNVTLTSGEAAYDIQEYTGALTGNISVIVPTAVSRWWVYNNTSGAFSLTVKTAAGTGIVIAQGTRQIFHCDGTNVVASVDAGTGTVTNIATGTGLTGGPITTTGTISLANTAVVAGTYGNTAGNPSITVDAQGRLTGVVADAGSASVYVPVVGGTAGAIILTPTIAATAYSEGQRFRFKAASASVAGGTTVNISSLGAKNLLKKGLTNIVEGDWNTGVVIEIVYDGTQFQLAAADSFAKIADIPSASTLNLTSAYGNLVDVTGNTAITAVALGEGKEMTVRFTGSPTITNGASLILPGGADIVAFPGDFMTFRGYASGVVRVFYDKMSGAPVAVLPSVNGFLLSSIAGTSTTATLTVSAGSAADSLGKQIISKSTTTSWAVTNGNAANGYQGGTTLPNSDTIHIFMCYGSSGICSFAHNGVTPTPPSGYNSYYVRVGSLNTNGSGAPIPATYIEIGGGAVEVILATAVSQTFTGSTSGALLIVNGIPTDIRVKPNIVVGAAGGTHGIITSEDASNVAPATNGTAPGINFANEGVQYPGFPNVISNTSGQVRQRTTSTDNNFLYCHGYTDFRRISW